MTQEEKQGEKKGAITAKEAWKDMRFEVYAQASGNRHEANVSDDSTKMFSLNDIDEIFEKIEDTVVEQKPDWNEDNERIRKAIVDFLSVLASRKENQTFSSEDFDVDSLNKWVQWLEKQGEQKPTDKVEPKFKVGDWIVYNDNLYHAGNIALQRYYECLRVDGTVHTFSLDIDSKSHLWTIQDAKDGDVLYECNEKTPFIFKELKTKQIGDIASYCDIFNGIFNSIGDNWTTLDIVPATKEQRDLLFQKMYEAGYEWDAEKKELKKIEQESAWSEEGGQKYSEDSCKKSDDIAAEEKDMTEYKNGFECGKQRVLKYPEDFGLCKKTLTAWSEEDVAMLDSAIAFVEHSAFTKIGKGKNNVIAWLKSLKERMKGE